MTPALTALVGFAAWTLALVLAIGGIRVAKVLRREVPPNGFPSGQKHGGEAYWRLNRAHANCVENLPVFAVLVLVHAVSGLDAPLVDTLAPVVLGARIGQTTAHVSSGSNVAVNVRFTFFLVQLGAMLAMVLALVGAL